MMSPEKRSEAFYAFERRGRGWDTYPEPVHLEPAFVPIPGRHTSDLATSALADESAPARLSVSFSISEEYRGDVRDTLSWLSTLSHISLPVTLELIRINGETSLHVAVSKQDRLFLANREAPGLAMDEGRPGLYEQVAAIPDAYTAFHAFGLLREWMLPASREPILGRVAALMAQLGKDEGAIVQVLFDSIRGPFQRAGEYAIRTPYGEPFFRNRPDFEAETDGKLTEPLFGVVLRSYSFATDSARLKEIKAALLGLIAGGAAANSYVPLAFDDAMESTGLMHRCSFRTGMLLGIRELAALVHPPVGIALTTDVLHPVALARGRTILGRVKKSGAYEPVRIPKDARLKPIHVVGATGTGKSTLLLNLMLNDASYGYGCALLDPHGDLSDDLLAHLPEERLSDVILFDPGDSEYVLGFNPLEARTEREREILASDLVAVFKRLATSWGDQMSTVLSYAILGVLSSGGGTLLDLLQFLSEKEARKEYLARSDDPFVRRFFEHEFSRLRGRPETSILTRLHGLLRVPLLRQVLLEGDKRLNLEAILADGKILIARLSKGAIGSENAALLGSLLVTRLHMAALMREGVAQGKRPPFYLYIDEVQEVMSPSLAEMFSGARKFGLGVVVAHQSLSQLEAREREALKSLLANAYTRIIFRVGAEDARYLARDLRDEFKASLTNLALGEAIVRSGRTTDALRFETIHPGRPARSYEEQKALATEILKRTATLRGKHAPEPSIGPLPDGRPQEPTEPPQEPQGAREAPEEPVAEVPSASAEKPLTEPPAPGHGGPEHRYLQGLVSEWAKSRGFRVLLEEPVLDGAGRVDVGLHKENRTLAVEIAVTTDVAHERGNIEKCRKADFDEVILVSTNEGLLSTLAAEFAEHESVHCFSPPELFSFLEGEPTEAGKVAGYRVSVSYDESAKTTGSSPITEILMRNLKRLQRKS